MKLVRISDTPILVHPTGVAVLAGVAVLIVLIPINGFIAAKARGFQISQMKSKDQRVKLMTEILNGIKVSNYGHVH